MENRVRDTEGETRTCPRVVNDGLLERAFADGREVLEPLVLRLFALLARVEQQREAEEEEAEAEVEERAEDADCATT